MLQVKPFRSLDYVAVHTNYLTTDQASLAMNTWLVKGITNGWPRRSCFEKCGLFRQHKFTVQLTSLQQTNIPKKQNTHAKLLSKNRMLLAKACSLQSKISFILFQTCTLSSRKIMKNLQHWIFDWYPHRGCGLLGIKQGLKLKLLTCEHCRNTEFWINWNNFYPYKILTKLLSKVSVVSLKKIYKVFIFICHRNSKATYNFKELESGNCPCNKHPADVLFSKLLLDWKWWQT